MRWLPVVLLLAGCTASNWQKPGATSAELDADYDDCRGIAKPDPAIAAIAGAFGAVGVLVGTTAIDSRIRSCLEGRGWERNGAEPKPAATAEITAPVVPAAVGLAAERPETAPAFRTVPVTATPAHTDAVRRLRELRALFDEGLITKEEYEERRQAIVHGL